MYAIRSYYDGVGAQDGELFDMADQRDHDLGHDIEALVLDQLTSYNFV